MVSAGGLAGWTPKLLSIPPDDRRRRLEPNAGRSTRADAARRCGSCCWLDQLLRACDRRRACLARARKGRSCVPGTVLNDDCRGEAVFVRVRVCVIGGHPAGSAAASAEVRPSCLWSASLWNQASRKSPLGLAISILRRVATVRRRLLCRFSDAGGDEPSTRSGGRRLKSAKARNRGRWGTVGAAGSMGI